MHHLNKATQLTKLNAFKRIFAQTLTTKPAAQPSPAPTKSTANIFEETKVKKFNERATYSTPGSLHYPSYLDKGEPFPNYERLEINLNGYDYTVLQAFFKYVEKICKALEIDVKEAIAIPSRSYDIKTLKPYSQNIDKEYKLSNYHRIVRISNLKSTAAPILLEALQLNLPEGISLEVRVPNADVEEFRYIPDLELNELKKSLDEINNPKN